MSCEESDIMNKWLGCFKSLLNPPSQLHNFIPALASSLHLDAKQLNNPITEEEVSTSLRKAPNSKAVGIDSIDTGYLKHDAITPYSCLLYSTTA